MTAATTDQPVQPRLPAPHYGGMTPFEQAASREWGLSLLDARALLVMFKHNRITCANLGSELWGSPTRGSGNCSCPWARPAGVVIKRLRELGLVERDRREKVLTLYRATSKVEALVTKLKRS